MTLIEQMSIEMKRRGRVCPIPPRWNELWLMLPGRCRKGNRFEPPAPLILAAWHHSSDEQKRERFLLHIQWAQEHSAEPLVQEFLDDLDESDWHYEERLS